MWQALIDERKDSDVDRVSKSQFSKMVKVEKVAGSDELCIPRRCSRQTLRSNVPGGTTKAYWRQAVCLPLSFLNHLLAELKGRFAALTRNAVQGQRLLPR